MKESAMVASMILWAKRHGCFCKKNHGSLYGVTGEPDLLVLIPVEYQTWAVPVFVEVKLPGKKPTRLQKKRMRDLKKFHVVVDWVDSMEKFKDLIENVKGAKAIENERGLFEDFGDG